MMSPRFPGTMAVRAVGVCLLSVALAAVGGELSPMAPGPPVKLSLPDIDGRLHNLEELRGKVVLVNFWASWCTPCIQEMPSIQRLAEAMRDNAFAVLGVNVGEGERRAKTIAQRLEIGFPVLLDKDSIAFRLWRANVLPTTYLIDKDGIVRYVGRGPLEWDDVEILDLLEPLTAADPTAAAK